MARTIGRLTALKIARTAKPGMYPDGGGLYLGRLRAPERIVDLPLFAGGRAREMGLGSLSIFGLLDARTKASECRRLRHEGIDPIEARKATRGQAALDAAKAITFKDAARSYIAAHQAGWHNEKHAAQWEATLATYAEPISGRSQCRRSTRRSCSRR